MEARKIHEDRERLPVCRADGIVEEDVVVPTYIVTARRTEVTLDKWPWLRAMLESAKKDLDAYCRIKPTGIEILFSSVGAAPEDYPCNEVIYDMQDVCRRAVSEAV